VCPKFWAHVSLQIITSMPAPGPEQLLLFASTRLPQWDGSPPRFKLLIRRLDIPDFAGPGAYSGSQQHDV
jgi:hypothetical protein